MKRFLTWFLVVLAVGMVGVTTGCNEKDEPAGGVPELVIDPMPADGTIELPAFPSGTYNMTVTGIVDQSKVSISVAYGELNQWMSLIVRRYGSTAEISLHYSANTSQAARRATLVIECNDQIHKLNIVQDAKPYFELPERISVTAEKGSGAFDFKGNGEFLIEPVESYSWITMGAADWDGENCQINFRWDENEGSGRLATFRLSSPKMNSVEDYMYLTVRQLPAAFGSTIDLSDVEPGQLEVKLGVFGGVTPKETYEMKDDFKSVDRINVSGSINGRDLLALRKAIRYSSGLTLDLSDCRIVAGTTSYYKYFAPSLDNALKGQVDGYTNLPRFADDELPEAVFAKDDVTGFIVGAGNMSYYFPLNDIVLPSTLKKLGKFSLNNSRIHSLSIPASVTEMCEGCIGNTPALESIEFETGSNLKSIGAHVFRSNLALRSLTLPSSQIEVDPEFFDDALPDGLTVAWTVPPTVKISSTWCGTTPLFVPAGCKAAYEASAEWSKFGSIIEM